MARMPASQAAALNSAEQCRADVLRAELSGAEIKMAHGQEDRNPVVLGRIGRDPSKPTVCFYGAHHCALPTMLLSRPCAPHRCR